MSDQTMSDGLLDDEMMNGDTERGEAATATRKPRRATRARRQPAPDATTGAQAFEEAMARLDEIVAQLEGGQLPLDQSLTLFEEGVRLYQQCQHLLDSAELRLEQLHFSVAAPAEPEASFFVEPFDLDER